MNATSDVGAAIRAIRPATARRVCRSPLQARLLSLFGVIVLGTMTAGMMVFGVIVFTVQAALGLFIMTLACFMAGLLGYVWRDLAGKWSLCVILDADAVRLDLPQGRSLINQPPPVHVAIAYSDIAAIETRLEAYGSLGMAMMQRAYVLRRKSGELIFLYEERALGSPMASSFFKDITNELAARAGVTIHDLGMVEGKGGFLGVWGTQPVNWAAPSLPLARQLYLWRHAAATGSLAFAIMLIALWFLTYVG